MNKRSAAKVKRNKTQFTEHKCSPKTDIYALCFFVTIRNQPSYAGKKISRVIREIFCNNKEASA